MNAREALIDAVSRGNRNEAKALTQAMLEQGTAATSIVEEALVPGMAAVGERFKRNEAFVPELLIAARAMKESLALLEPSLAAAGIKPKWKAVIGTVEGDLHDIGKNLVAMMWRGANIDVVDLGINVPCAKFVAAVKEHHPDIVGLSALLTTTMPSMKETVATLKREVGNRVKVVIGGAPVSEQFATQIGADGFASDAATAVEMVAGLLAK